jgi:hypothetical protein
MYPFSLLFLFYLLTLTRSRTNHNHNHHHHDDCQCRRQMTTTMRRRINEGSRRRLEPRYLFFSFFFLSILTITKIDIYRRTMAREGPNDGLYCRWGLRRLYGPYGHHIRKNPICLFAKISYRLVPISKGQADLDLHSLTTQ